MKNILRLDSRSPNLVPISEVEDQLKTQQSIEDLVRKIQFVGKTGWYRDHPVFKAVAEEWDDVYEYKSDSSIRELIESAKKRTAK